MKKYRILYWLGSMTTEYLITAPDVERAIEKFERTKGDSKRIFRVEETN